MKVPLVQQKDPHFGIRIIGRALFYAINIYLFTPDDQGLSHYARDHIE